MSTVIKAQNLGKKYLIRHESQARYATLGEKISSIFKRPSKTETEEFWALKNIDFEIQQGDRFGIIGRNGAGKSTLLKILSRITEPTTGSIGLKGRVASLLEVGTGFHPELTGRENIYLNGAILGMSRNDINKRLDEIIAFSEVEKFLDTPVKRYSSGMYVRLAFAVAAHLEPEILIVDEVLAVGDAQFQKKCLGKMEDAGQEGRTVLFVSHSMAAIQQLCTKAIILEHGTLSFNGSVKEATDKYLLSSDERSKLSDMQNRPRAEQFGLGATINNFRLLDTNNTETTTFRFGQDIFAEINYTGQRHLKNINLVVGIDSLHNDRIITAVSPNDLKLELTNQQTNTARVRINLTLNPGTYLVTVAIRQDLSKVIDHIKHVVSFTVTDVREDRLIDETLLPFGHLSATDLDWSLV